MLLEQRTSFDLSNSTNEKMLTQQTCLENKTDNLYCGERSASKVRGKKQNSGCMCLIAKGKKNWLKLLEI